MYTNPWTVFGFHIFSKHDGSEVCLDGRQHKANDTDKQAAVTSIQVVDQTAYPGDVDFDLLTGLHHCRAERGAAGNDVTGIERYFLADQANDLAW